MKRSSFIYVLLTFLMFLLVLGAAVIFLADRNQELDQAVSDRESEQVALRATRDQLLTDLEVRDAVFDLAQGTRDALADQVSNEEQKVATLESQLSQQVTARNQAEEALEQIALQVFIFSPKNGAKVPPAVPIELVIAARAEAGLESVEVAVNDGDPERFRTEGQRTDTLRTEWTPEAEGEYVIRAVAHGRDGQTSQPVTVTISAAYRSQQERENAIRQQLASDVTALRVPEPTATPVPALAEYGVDADFHHQLLTGRETYSEQEIIDDTLVLQAFDFVPADYNLVDYIDTVVTRNLLGYADPVSATVTIYDSDAAAGSFAQWLEVHDVAHSLQDEHFQLSELVITGLDADARAAVRALAEGDATFLQYLYLQGDYLGEEEKEAVRQGLKEAETAALDRLPVYLRDSFESAYTAGFRFVENLYEDGGFKAVDEAWNNPPRTTEEILHPDLYGTGESPESVTLAPLADVLGENWRLVDQEDTFGELQLRQYLQQQLDADQVDSAASGWGGGRYAVYWNEDDEALVMILRLAWDSPEDIDQFHTAYTNYLRSRFGTEGLLQDDEGRCWQNGEVICLYLIDDESLVVRAPDQPTAAAVAALQPGVATP